MSGIIVPISPAPLRDSSRVLGKAEQSSANDSDKSKKKGLKGHSKSRRGCFDCKRRKVKCQETRPKCLNCSRLGLRCRYGPDVVVPSPTQSTTLHVNCTFSLTDMRLYHHFLNAAYPHFPVRSDNVWLMYIMPIGHQCEYLMHAMLALAASHLEKLAPNGLTPIAQSHRLEAIRGLNHALAMPLHDAEEGDAAIAACYALFMQSWYMDDGLQASLVLTRSLDLTTRRVRDQDLGSIFAGENGETRLSSMKGRIRDCPKFDVDFIDAAVASVRALEPLLTWDFERELWSGLVDAFSAFYGEAVDAYTKYIHMDTLITNLPHTSLLHLLSPSPTNPTCRLLLAHLVALHLSMRPISCRERRHYTVSFYGIRMGCWIPDIERSLGMEWKGYVRWPMVVARLHLRGELEGFSLGKGKKKGVVYDLNLNLNSVATGD